MADPLAKLAKDAAATAPKAKEDDAPVDGKTDAMKDLLAAIEAKDAAAMALAFERAHIACADAEAEDEDEDEDDYALEV